MPYLLIGLAKLPLNETLPRVMGPFSATMLGVGAMIGAGIFLLSGIAAGHAGPALLLSFILNGCIALAIGSCYAELGSAMPRAGGSYYWVKQAFGHGPGFGVGWIGMYASSVAAALYALGFGAFATALLNRAGIAIDVSLPATLLLTAAIFSLHYFGANDTSLAENAVTLTKVILLLVLAAGGITLIVTSPSPLAPFSPFMPNGWNGVLLAMATTFVAFEGFEVITRAGEDLRQPYRNIPRSIYFSIAITVTLYILISFALIGAVQGPGGEPGWMRLGELGELGMAATARQLLPYGDVIFYCAGIASTASAMIASTFGAVRLTFALSRAGDLPAPVARLHHRFLSPYRAVGICAALVLLMVLSLPIVEVAGAASQMYALLFMLVCLSAWRLRKTRPDLPRPFRVPLLTIIAPFGAAAGLTIFVALLEVSPVAWIVSCLWLLFGLLLFRYFHR